MNSRNRKPARGPIVVAVLGLGLILLGVGAPSLAQGWKSPPRRAPADGRVTPVAPVDPFRPERGGVYSNLGLLDRLARDAVREIADSLRLPPGSEVTLLSTTWHEGNWFVGSLLAETLTDRGYRVSTGDWGQPPDTAAPAPPARASAPPGSGRPTHPPPGGGKESGEDASSFGEQGEVVAPGDTTAANPDSVETPIDPLWGPRGDERAESTESETAAPSRRAPAAAAPRRELPAGNVLDLRVLEFGVSYPQVGRRLLLGPVRFTRVGGVFAQVHSLVGPEGEFRQMVSAERHRVDRLSGSQRALVEGASYPFTPPGLKPPSLSRYIEPTVVVAIVGSLVYLFYANQK